MEPFTSYTALAAILDRQNVDTDQIIPKQFLKKIERTGFGKHLFHDWRYLDEQETQPNPDFILNAPRYQGAGILVARDNFGCGSSREHAPWALVEYGFRAVVAPGFADIFFNNCTKNGMVPVALAAAEVEALFREIETNEGTQLTVDLQTQTLTSPGGLNFSFAVPPFARNCLLKGLDHIGWTLQHESEITWFEEKHHGAQPWLLAG